jgi:uncharacterized RDD family membrane protein YckC
MIAARPAGFWIRAVAALGDFGVFALVQLSFRFIGAKVWGPDADGAATFMPLVSIFTVGFAAAYTTVLHALGGQTIGKMLVGIRVVVGDGEPPPVGTALLRFLGYFASGGIVALGFVMAGLRHDKRALHDLIAGTRVEWLPTAPGREPAEPSPVTAESSAAANTP